LDIAAALARAVGDTRGRHENVEAAECVGSFLHQSVDRCRITHVGVDEESLPTLVLHRNNSFAGAVVADVGDDHVSPSSANRSQQGRPMPLPPPVTTPSRPSNTRVFVRH
jgi:hypothetical protein